MDITRINTTTRFSDATIHNGVLYYVEVPNTASLDITEQTHDILNITDAFLKANNSGLDRLLMVTIYLTNIADIHAVNAVYDQRIPSGCAPVRACLQVTALAQPHYKIEIAFVAACR